MEEREKELVVVIAENRFCDSALCACELLIIGSSLSEDISDISHSCFV